MQAATTSTAALRLLAGLGPTGTSCSRCANTNHPVGSLGTAAASFRMSGGFPTAMIVALCHSVTRKGDSQLLLKEV